MKRFVSVLTAIIIILATLSFAVVNTSAAATPKVSYKISDSSNGGGYIDLTTGDKAVRLANSGENTTVVSGTMMTVTVFADKSSVIKDVKVNGERMGENINSMSISFTFEEVTDNVTIEVTYDRFFYNCSYTTEGRGKVSVQIPDYYYDNNCSVLYGDKLVYHVEADKGYEILNVYFDDKELDLALFGKTGNKKMDVFDFSLGKVTASHKLHVVFSGESLDTVETFKVSISYDNTRGICNNGINKDIVEFGTNYQVKITPYDGYKVDKIIDGNNVITDFTGEEYTIENITTNRALMVIFGIDDKKAEGIEVGFQTPTEAPTEAQETVPAKARALALDDEDNTAVVFGDANLDGKVNVVDVTIVQKGVAGLLSFDGDQMFRADVDGDGQITVKDATLIQKKVAMIVPAFPVN